MTAPRPYQSWFRVLDHHGVLHLARPTDYLGQCLCGRPPVGTKLTDPIGDQWAPGQRVTMPYRRMCPACNEVAAGETTKGHPS